jgi:hypothetical protein
MKKLALFVAIAALAASPAMAQNKKSKAQKQPEMADWEKQNDNSARLVRDSLPMWLPSWAQPIYHGAVKPKMEADAKPVAKKKKSKTAAKTN